MTTTAQATDGLQAAVEVGTVKAQPILTASDLYARAMWFADEVERWPLGSESYEGRAVRFSQISLNLMRAAAVAQQIEMHNERHAARGGKAHTG